MFKSFKSKIKSKSPTTDKVPQQFENKAMMREEESVDNKETLNEFMSMAKQRFDERFDQLSPSKPMELSGIRVLQTLGTGSYGRVILVRRNGNIEAMKMMKKRDVFRARQVAHTLDEKKYLSLIRHPFIVELYETFKDNSNLYMMMEYAPGGELFSVIRKSSFGKLPEKQAKFYAGQIVLIFEYLHKLNLIFRDLKPENILISPDGYIKLADFGFVKHCRGRAYTLCGTPEYLGHTNSSALSNREIILKR